MKRQKKHFIISKAMNEMAASSQMASEKQQNVQFFNSTQIQ